MKRRVVVTGMGAVTPLGLGVDAFWEGLVQGRSGVGPITQFDASAFSTRIAAEVKDFDPTDFMDKKDARRMDRFAQFAVAGARMALEDAGISDNVDWERVGVLIGSGIGGIHTFEEQCRNLFEKGPDRVSPFFVPMMIPDMAAGQVSILLGAKGHNACTVTACASGSHSIGDAFKVIQRGQADVMITGGTEAAVSALSMAGFCAARTLSTRNDEPERASRPWDKARDGFVIGEGAGVIILERAEHAAARGARVYARLAGAGLTSDGFDIVQPDPQGRGAVRAITLAIQDADVAKSDITHVNAHATSTPVGDVAEVVALREALGDHPVLTATKSMLGHSLGAAGALESIATVLAVHEAVVPPTINLDDPDDALTLDVAAHKARHMEIPAALNNSFGFGGHNVALIFTRA